MNFKSIQIVFARSICCVGMALLLGLSTAAEADDDKTAQNEKARYGDQQRLFGRINVLEAWEITKGDPEVLVGVIDNGYDFFHPELKGQLIPGYYFSGGFHTEFYVGIAHGTMISSIIVAKDDNTGMVGLAPQCRAVTASQGMIEHKLLKMQKDFFRANPQASMADFQQEMTKHSDVMEKFGRDWVHYHVAGAADAVRYLVDRDVKVINISSVLKRSLCPSVDIWNSLEEAFAYAAERDVVIVLGAGNNAQKWEDYPGGPESVIVAGATLLDDTRWETEVNIKEMKITTGSNYGKRLTVMAPVEHIVTCKPHEKRFYETLDGPMGAMKTEFHGNQEVVPNGATSSAAPIVTALVALVFSVRPDLDVKTAIEIVKQGCDDIGETGYDIHTGHGRVNFGKTIKIALQWAGKS